MNEQEKIGEVLAVGGPSPSKILRENIDFSSKDFEKTQELLNARASINNLNADLENINQQKESILGATLKNSTGDNDDVIQKHLDKYTLEELEKYLDGPVTEKRVKERINEFFTNPDTGELLEMVDSDKPEAEELDFKRGLLLYFKRSDYYIKKIDEEYERYDKVVAELNSDLSKALNPLKDNVLAFAEYLETTNQILEEDTPDIIKGKKKMLDKAYAIKSGYTFDLLFDLIEKYPNIVDNSLREFRKETTLKDTGKRYGSKLKSRKINFNLFPLLSDDPTHSLEYRVLPQGDYPAGLEGFTVFFLIRYFSKGLADDADVAFHASVQVALTQLMNSKLDEDVAEQVKESIMKLLSYFS